MRRLARRIRAHGQTAAPVVPVSRVTGAHASPAGPGVMPEAAVLVYPSPGGAYSAVAYRGLEPLFAADGAAVPATAPGRWGQLRAAGRS